MGRTPEEGRDYYEVLGVVRSAAPEQIETAFRELARRWHPDVCHDAHLAARNFKRIAEAYEVLCDPESRRKYDRSRRRVSPAPVRPPSEPTRCRPAARRGTGRKGTLEEFAELLGRFFDQGAASGKASRGDKTLDVEVDLPISPEEAREGGTVEISLTFSGRCAKCSGAGAACGKTCGVCHGSGTIREEPRRVTITVPPGVRTGTVLRAAGHGKSGHASSGPGDLYLHVQIRPCW